MLWSLDVYGGMLARAGSLFGEGAQGQSPTSEKLDKGSEGQGLVSGRGVQRPPIVDD
jgi:hypothetical protein